MLLLLGAAQLATDPLSQTQAHSFDCADVTQIPQIECEALVALYYATDGDNWDNRSGWLETNTPCWWHEVQCSNNHVDSLGLQDNNLIGQLPPELGSLTSLVGLDLSRNQLSGEIPAELGGLPLTHLHLEMNELTGEIPAALGNLTNVRWLFLHNNQLNGGIPISLGNLTTLTALDLSNNHLGGQIPVELGNLENLIGFWLYNNQLSGEIPVELGNLTSLISLSLHSNQLTGEIPAELGNLVNLRESLSLQNNQLSGEIPTELGSLTQLRRLYLQNNHLRGPIPIELGNLTALEQLDLSDNQLSGEIPAELGDLTSLRLLGLANNQLTGQIPATLGDLSSVNLWMLYLHGNQLSGGIPVELLNLWFLRILSLHDNQLSGPIPEEFVNFSFVRGFSFYDTDLCTPDTPEMNNWLAGIEDLQGTGWVCGQPTATLAGMVANADGGPLPGTQVVLYRNVSQVEKHVVSQQRADSNGRYEFAELGQGINYYLNFVDVSGQWASQYFEDKRTLGTADPITLTLGITQTIDVQLDWPVSPLVDVTVDSGAATIITDPAFGITYIVAPVSGATSITLAYEASCDGGTEPEAVTLHYNNHSYVMIASNGFYAATIPADAVTSSGDIVITTTCAGDNSDALVATLAIYDPVGFVADKLTGEPIVGATVTLYHVPGWYPKTSEHDTRSNSCQSNNSKAPDAPWNQPAPTHLGIIANPDWRPVTPSFPVQYTNDVGQYGWGVPTGCWYVVVQADRYSQRTSPVVGVPPDVADLKVLLLGQDYETLFLPVIIHTTSN